MWGRESGERQVLGGVSGSRRKSRQKEEKEKKGREGLCMFAGMGMDDDEMRG